MYLSIDLDFWNDVGIEEMEAALIAVRESKKLKKVVDNHKGLLRPVNKAGYKELVNVDQHSDLYARGRMESWRPSPKINCGNWVNYVDESLRGVYRWICPKGSGVDCASSYLPSPYHSPETVGWEDAEKVEVEGFPFHLIKEAKVIGISISYYYLDNYLSKKATKQLLKKVFHKDYPQTCYVSW